MQVKEWLKRGGGRDNAVRKPNFLNFEKRRQQDNVRKKVVIVIIFFIVFML